MRGKIVPNLVCHKDIQERNINVYVIVINEYKQNCGKHQNGKKTVGCTDSGIITHHFYGIHHHKSYTQNYRKNAEDNINNLLSAGIVVRVNRNYHEHFAIIDRKICWYGSMNLLSKPKEDDNLMRIVNNEMSNELLEIVTNVSQ